MEEVGGSRIHRDAVRRWLENTGEKLGFHIHSHMLRYIFCKSLRVCVDPLKSACTQQSVNETPGRSTPMWFVPSSRKAKRIFTIYK